MLVSATQKESCQGYSLDESIKFLDFLISLEYLLVIVLLIGGGGE